MEEKLNSPPRHSALACRARLPCTLRRDPWGFEASRALHRHRGGPNLKMLPLSLRAEVLHSLTATASQNSATRSADCACPAVSIHCLLASIARCSHMSKTADDQGSSAPACTVVVLGLFGIERSEERPVCRGVRLL